MTYAVIILALVVVVLCYALYYQVKAGHSQAGEQETLLADYQRRVDEQQKLLEDYRSLEKNFENVGQGYEQALELYDKIEENSRKLEESNARLVQQNSELVDAKAKMEEAARAGKDFYRQIAQDIMQEADKAGAASASRIPLFVNKMLDFNDMDSDSPIERLDQVQADKIAQQAVAESGIDQSKYFEFNMKMTDHVATPLKTNAKQVAHALALVFENARKFTTDGSVTLAINADAAQSKLSFAVEDTGMGIPAEEAEHIFEPYVKLNKYFDGQGLGLTFARSIARRLGGDLVLDTTFEGKGSRFVLTLPM